MEIHQYPRAHASQLRYPVEHSELVAVDTGLILLGPALVFSAMQTGLGVAAKLAHNQWLLVGDAPLGRIRVLRALLIPADVFIEADHVQRLAQRIVNDLGVSLSAHQQRRGNQPRGVKLPRASGFGFNEARPRLVARRLVGHRP